MACSPVFRLMSASLLTFLSTCLRSAVRRSLRWDVGERVAECGSGGDAEFGEDLVQVGGDRSRGEEEAGGDLFVGVARGSEQGDLALLWRERVEAGVGLGGGGAGGPQFTVRAVRPGSCTEPLKDLRGGCELVASLGSSL